MPKLFVPLDNLSKLKPNDLIEPANRTNDYWECVSHMPLVSGEFQNAITNQ